MSRILIAEDEPRIASFVAKGLGASGFTTTIVEDGASALAHAVGGEYDLIILDVGLPAMDGFEVLRRLRGTGSALPVIILTARDSAADTIAGLEGGADDYMSKPFSFGELLARIRLRLRAPSGGDSAAMELSAGAISLDVRSRQVRVDGKVRDLSAREFTLLETFLRNPGQVLSREQLLSHVWGYDFDPGSNVVDVYVRYLRRKLGAEVIETVRGMGYRLRA
ncbi:DNA-binding response OmpR family regulator [Kineosphaera limosa]|uniref:Putative two-component response regulator n=1 Tax=Kineosphaera limosa NBRC 100340 TaxID=1184609 RepID=K6VD63_9MICO|nr:response regulator transcription factor [Kineosphaera limosa]NYE02293.1 DNA-binding response OmpR family regulator [Kineosphaera limosa]GAB94148.1 putative two-component response regulator [Kineosphaera limosa NBRC 100340]